MKELKLIYWKKIYFFKFILPLVLKEKHSSKKVTILKDINERGIYRTETSLSSLKTEISIEDQLTENEKKKFKQNKEIEICSYSLIAFLYKHRHIVQTSCAKELSRKGIKDGNMNAISFNQYEWTDSMIEVPNKIIINDKVTPFIVSSNTYITDVLIIEVFIDSPLLIIKENILLIIKENINCGNFLYIDKFNSLIERVNYKPLTYFPIIDIDERLDEEALFHIFSHNGIYSNTYMDRIMTDFKILNSIHLDRLHHDYSNTTTT